MKSLILAIILFFVSASVFAYSPEITADTNSIINSRRPSLSFNVLALPLGGFNTFYEKPLQGVSHSIAIGFGYANFRPILSDSRVEHFALTAEYKFYIENSDFYLSPYAKYRLVSRNYPYLQNQAWNQLGAGGTFGFQHIFRSGFLIQSFFGLGVYTITHQIGESEEQFYNTPSPIDLRLGLSLGFALK